MEGATPRRPVQLHVIHDLGGGSDQWVRDFGATDSSRANLVLRSLSQGREMANALGLYESAADEAPARVWQLSQAIPAAAARHPEYRAILEQILDERGVDVLMVSSLLGHSLDLLETDRRTILIAHDYFPYCPAINLHFGETCRSCDDAKIARCARENDAFNPFVDFPASERSALRQRYMELILRANVTLAVPSASVRENLTRLDPRFREVSFAIIPHGHTQILPRLAAEPSAHERLRVLVLGQISVAKGLHLLNKALPAITEFAEVYLLGCGELGELFKYRPHVHVTSRYQMDELAIHAGNVNPHVALLASIVPETFGYALSELLMLGVPVAATRVGSFAERIQDRETGYLFDPDPGSMAAVLREIDENRPALAKIRKNLRSLDVRSAADMVADYHRLAPVSSPRGSAARPGVNRATPGAGDPALAAQATTLAGMWKEVKSLNIQLNALVEARRREDGERRRLEGERDRLSSRVEHVNARIGDQARQLEEKEKERAVMATQLEVRSAQLLTMLASTSWRISAPVRWLGRGLRRAKVIARILLDVARHPASAGEVVRRLRTAWQEGGVGELKRTLVGLQPPPDSASAWIEYRRRFGLDVRPRIISRIGAMAARPRVSVLVPTYNTPEQILREMIESVLAQLYPEWELCIADDGSSEAHVAAVLKEYAAREPRIRLDLASDNGGVSRALNRALAMASSEFVVLLDHDDLLEEQALFRVAESIVEDDPDMVYSDEILLDLATGEVGRYAYRPAFSLEYLRSHPYIVHLVGFRSSLLRDLGGFDETLRISQDYDLILRVAEKARRIVHIPEILYQWRLHEDSSGTRQQPEVMRTSRAILERHLARCGEAGVVYEGAEFNFFEVCYPLRAGLKVAIVIPTKNHGDLLQQCITSLRGTVRGVAHDIIVVDHQSDEPRTVAYLASLPPDVRVLRYQGPFNFSAINNWAVAHLPGSYSHYLLCNNDIEAMRPGWLEKMLELGQKPEIGIVGAKLLYPDRKSIQHAGVCVGAYGAAEHYAKRLRLPEDPIGPGYRELMLVNHELSAVTAACMLISREAFEAVSGFDEAIAVGFGDVDLCLRAGKAGYRILFCPHAELIHYESFTRGTSTEDPHPEDSATFRHKWADFLKAGDPYHSPAFAINRVDWAVSDPLRCEFEIRRRIVSRDASTGLEKRSFSAVDGRANG